MQVRNVRLITEAVEAVEETKSKLKFTYLRCRYFQGGW
jgi:hypothetical protein